MGFFNFSNKSAASSDGNGDQQVKRPVVIQLNDDSITIPASEAEGKTISQLFDENGRDLGDVDRINRYVAAGRIVDADATVELGTVYRGAITSEAKGATDTSGYVAAVDRLDAIKHLQRFYDENQSFLQRGRFNSSCKQSERESLKAVQCSVYAALQLLQENNA